MLIARQLAQEHILVTSEAGEEVARLQFERAREWCGFQIGSSHFEVYRRLLMQGPFLLDCHSQIVATATAALNLYDRTRTVSHSERTLEISPLRRNWPNWSRTYNVTENGRQIGVIRPTKWYSNKAMVDLPDDIDLSIKLISFALVFLMWLSPGGLFLLGRPKS